MKKGSRKFIIDVVPLTRIPLTRNQSFSYLYDKELPAGTLVSVSLFKRKVEGVVLRSRNDFKRLGNIELKKVEKVIEENFLTEKQLKLAQFISDYYIAPLGIVLKNFVPKRAKARSRSSYLVSGILYKKKNIKLTLEQQKAVGLITNTRYKILNTKYLLHGPAGSGKTEVYIHSIIKLREKYPEAQFLILIPEKTLTPQAIERYGEYFDQKETVVLSSNLSKGQFYSNWLKIRTGEAKIIIGTRMAVFAPFKKLGLVVIDEEQDMSYKQWDMNPRYDARTAAENLAETFRCPIVRGSATPSVESYCRTVKEDLRLIKLPALNIRASSIFHLVSSEEKNIPSTILVDMKKERWAKNFNCISKKLKGEISYALKNKLQSVLLINRQGMSNFSICDNCKTVLRCPKCERALIYDNQGYYRCVHCSHKTSITPKCSECGGLAFKNIGLGTQKVEREINNLFPGARVARIDSQAIRAKNYQEKIYADFSARKIDVLIGTQMISKGWDFPDVGLVGIIDLDNMLGVPDFATAEKAFQTVSQVAGRTNRPGARFPGTIVVQSFNPENRMVKTIAERNFEAFYQQEIKERELLKLPPFQKIIKLTFQDYNKKKVENITEEVYNILKERAGKISIYPPQEAYIPNVRGRFRRQIILKTGEKRWPTEAKNAILSLPSGWIVDVDPISIV